MRKIICGQDMAPITAIYYGNRGSAWIAHTNDAGYIAPHSHYYNPINREHLYNSIDALTVADAGEQMADQEIDDLRGEVAHDFLTKIVNGICSEANQATGYYMSDFQRLGRKAPPYI
jgi:hypothetical protein